MNHQKGLAHIAAVVVIVVISLSMIGVTYYFKSEYNKQDTTTSATTPTTNTTQITNSVVNTNSTIVTNTTVDATDGWLTYTNNNLGYTIMHPRDWSTKEYETGSIQLLPPGVSEEFQGENDLKGAISITNGLGGDVLVDPSDITIGGVLGERGRLLGIIGFTATVLSDGTNEFSIRWSSDHDVDVELYEQILSTFQFTSGGDNAGWLTYDNKRQGYSVMYPESQIVSEITNPTLNEPLEYTVFDNIRFVEKETEKFVNYEIQVRSIDPGNLGANNPTISQYTVDELIGTRLDFVDEISNKRNSVVVVERNSLFYVIWDMGKESDNSIFEQILSTFKFTEN